MNLTTFDFNEAPVRVLLRDEQPWFVAADVCRVLEIANSRDAIAELDEDERTVATADTLRANVGKGGSNVGSAGSNVANADIRIPNRGMQIISESGLYALVFKSRKPEARAFRKWVTMEVLPALRLTGRYVTGDHGLAGAAPGTRRVRDDMMELRGLLLSSAHSVQLKMLDVGRAQQVANLAARFLETIKLEGDAIGYETLFEMRAGAAGNGLLPPDGGPAAKPLQGVPQRGVPRTAADEPGLPGAAAGGEEALGGAEPGAGAAACAAVPGTADLGSEADGCAAAVPGAGGPAARAE